MPDAIKIIVAVPPGQQALLTAGDNFPFTAARMIYGIGRGFRLYYYPRGTRGASGGYMVLDIGGFHGGGPASALVSDVIAECKRRSYTGIVIDSGGSAVTPLKLSLCRALAHAADAAGFEYFVPEALGNCGDNSILRVPTALSGGTLARHLSDALDKYGVTRVAVEIERVRMDFTLPARSGIGKSISSGALQELSARHGLRNCYSPELAVNYFTYREKNAAHFVLFDDALSIRNKLALAGSFGIRHAFLFYPQVSDLLSDITSRL